MFSGNYSLFLVESITRYYLLPIYLPQRDGRLSWPEQHEREFCAPVRVIDVLAIMLLTSI